MAAAVKITRLDLSTAELRQRTVRTSDPNVIESAAVPQNGSANNAVP